MKILLVAGEASADLHAGHVIERLKSQTNVELFGIGGDHLKALGLNPIATPKEMGVVGLTEAVSRIPQTFRLWRELTTIAKKEKPDLALLIDLPDFNLRLATRLKALGIPVVYFIAPQVWAWRENRVHQMARVIDRLLCILPFEEQWFGEFAPPSLKVDYVGHPAIEEIPDLPYEPNEEMVVLMPGSREKEIHTHLPLFLEAAARMKRSRANLRFSLPLASPLRNNDLINSYFSEEGPFGKWIKELGTSFEVLERPAHEALRKAKLALVASGTATLETAVVGVPMVVVYRVSGLTAFIFRHVVNYQGPVAMANLIHEGLKSSGRLVPELLQEDATPERMAEEALQLFADQDRWKKTADRLTKTRQMLTKPGATPLQNVVQHLLEYA